MASYFSSRVGRSPLALSFLRDIWGWGSVVKLKAENAGSASD